MSAIYLDYNATTPCDPEVVAAMVPYFTEIYGNPANGFHPQGRKSAQAIDTARQYTANLIHADSSEIIFTAGATESNNLAIRGLAHSHVSSGRTRIVTSAVEHKAVLLPCQRLAQSGFDIQILPVDADGQIDLDAAAEIIDTTTLLVSVQAANNEVGTLQPVSDIARLAHQVGAVFHCDAAQAIGKIPVDVVAWDVDLLSISAHKFYGPKGIGALYVRRSGSVKMVLYPLMEGGGQERGLRAGTLNVPGIVGMGEAARLATDLLEIEAAQLRAQRNQFELSLIESIPSALINGRGGARLPNTSSVILTGVDADALLLNLPDVMMGTGSACSYGTIEPSHVLTAMGIDRTSANSTIRASFGRFVTDEDVRVAVERITDAYFSLC